MVGLIKMSFQNSAAKPRLFTLRKRFHTTGMRAQHQQSTKKVISEISPFDINSAGIV